MNDAEKALATWDASLPDHLRFNEESLQLQLSMFDTSSNAGAWCYFMTHIIHTACVLMVYDVSLPSFYSRSYIAHDRVSISLHQAKFRTQGLSVSETRSWARERMLYILTSIGNRAKNSFLGMYSASSPILLFFLSRRSSVQSSTSRCPIKIPTPIHAFSLRYDRPPGCPFRPNMVRSRLLVSRHGCEWTASFAPD